MYIYIYILYYRRYMHRVYRAAAAAAAMGQDETGRAPGTAWPLYIHAMYSGAKDKKRIRGGGSSCAPKTNNVLYDNNIQP